MHDGTMHVKYICLVNGGDMPLKKHWMSGTRKAVKVVRRCDEIVNQLL